MTFEFVDWAERAVSGQRAGDSQSYMMSLGYRLYHLGFRGEPGRAIAAPITEGAGMILGLPTKESEYQEGACASV